MARIMTIALSLTPFVGCLVVAPASRPATTTRLVYTCDCCHRPVEMTLIRDCTCQRRIHPPLTDDKLRRACLQERLGHRPNRGLQVIRSHVWCADGPLTAHLLGSACSVEIDRNGDRRVDLEDYAVLQRKAGG